MRARKEHRTIRYIALWRGINVGKAKRLAMADLKALLTELGATNISTLLNSGNAVFDMRRKITGEQIRTAVREHLGVDARVRLLAKLGLACTTRNWATVTKLDALANPR